MITFYLSSTIEKSFFKYKLNNIHLFENTHNQYFIDVYNISFVTDFVISNWDKVILLNHENLKFTQEEKDDFASFKTICEEKSKKLAELLNIYSSGYQENLLQKAFYDRLIYSIDQFLDGSHPAFKDKEQFLGKRNIVNFLPLPDNVIESASIENISKLKTIKSPGVLIKAFTHLADSKYCLISDIESFVYHRFQFNSQYEVNADKPFHFRWDADKHILSDLLGRMKKKRSINATYPEIAQWVLSLTGLKSAESVMKYSSGAKKISSKKVIDLQLFR